MSNPSSSQRPETNDKNSKREKDNCKANNDEQDRYTNLIQQQPKEFFSQLKQNIKKKNKNAILLQVDAIKDAKDVRKVKNPKKDEASLLQMAANYTADSEVIIKLAEKFPHLIVLQRDNEFEGQTVLHTFISQQKLELVRKVLNILVENMPKELPTLLLTKAIGPRFVATVLMGELPLTVAALTFNMDMVKLLYEYGAPPHARNSEGDTMLHSLVRWAALYPEKLNEVKMMIESLHKWLISLTRQCMCKRRKNELTNEKDCTGRPVQNLLTIVQNRLCQLRHLDKCCPQQQVPVARSVWFVENDKGLTPLRLAASLAQPSLLNLMLRLESLYYRLDKNDGVFDSLEYDVTEIDPVARRLWLENRASNLSANKVKPVHALGLPPSSQQMLDASFFSSTLPLTISIRASATKIINPFIQKRTAAVLELICETEDMKDAFLPLENYVLRSIIKKKWFHYRKYFWAWFLLHILWMTLLSTYAIYRAKLIPTVLLAGSSATNVTSGPSDVHRKFVDGVAGLSIVGGLLLVLAEGMRYFHSGQPLALLSVHYNGVYRLFQLALGLSLFIDGIWYFTTGPENNYFLILALLVGWWFLTFFLRPFHRFSYYTVLLQKVLLGDMIRFCLIISLELLSFSLSMYIVYIPSEGGSPEGLHELNFTLLTMFNLMMGFGDLDVLNAPRPWLAIALYISFVLLTYLLMLNSLIAMMSNTCNLVSENKVKQGDLQRLSVVLMIEGTLPRRLTCNSGKASDVKYYDYRREQKVRENRYFTKIASVSLNAPKIPSKAVHLEETSPKEEKIASVSLNAPKIPSKAMQTEETSKKEDKSSGGGKPFVSPKVTSLIVTPQKPSASSKINPEA